MPYDYAPRLAARARARRRRHLFFTLCLLTVPALSLQTPARAVGQASTIEQAQLP